MTARERKEEIKKKNFKIKQNALALRSQIDYYFRLKNFILLEIKSNEYTTVYTSEFKKEFSFKVNKKNATVKMWLPNTDKIINFLSDNKYNFIIVKDPYYSIRPIIDSIEDFIKIYEYYLLVKNN